MKYFLSTLITMIAATAMAQTVSEIIVKPKDLHYAAYSSAVVCSDGSYMLTADETGKIIRSDMKSFGTTTAIRSSSGIPVAWMKLVNNDTILLFSQKVRYGNPATDSLFFYHMYNKTVNKIQSSVTFMDHSLNDVMIAKSQENYKTTLSLYDDRFNAFGSITTYNEVEVAAVSPNKLKVAYSEGNLAQQKEIVISDLRTGSAVSTIPLLEGMHVKHMYFDESSAELYLISIAENSQEIRVYKTSGGIISENPLYKLAVNMYGRSTKVIDNVQGNRHNMVLSSSVFTTRPVLLTGERDSFSATIVEIDNASDIALSLPKTQQTLFFKVFNTAFDDLPGFKLFDNQKKKFIAEFPPVSNGFYKGSFLPGSNWVLTGTRYDQGIKYFSSGTFDNRFGKIKIKDYLELHHGLTSVTMHLDPRSGNYIINGYEKGQAGGNVNYFRYDLIANRVSLINDDAGNFFHVLDYKKQDDNELLLLLNQEYTSQDTGPGYKLKLINNTGSAELPGLFKSAKLSGNARLLMTIDGNNKLQINEVDSNREIYSNQLDPGFFKIYDVGDEEFIITAKYHNRKARDCYNETILLNYADGKITAEAKQCVTVNDVAYQNDQMAMILNETVVVVGDHPILFKEGEAPIALSFNHDASLFMVSFRNGFIKIYDSNSHRELGAMIHPDQDKHIFYDSNGNYFSNIDADVYLTATLNGKRSALKQIEKQAFRPDKILEIFGEPDHAYVDALAQATRLRQQSVGQAPVKSVVNTDPAEGKPELYIISIGVSDYRQSDFNLTFADKDALDMARIYGQLDTETLHKYKNKFFGNNFNLYRQKEKVAYNMKRYLPAYSSYKNFYPVSPTIWVEVDSDRAVVWDFVKQSTDSISLPKDFAATSWGIAKLHAYSSGKGFAIWGIGQKVLSYDIKNKKSRMITIPDDLQRDNFKIRNEREWLYVTHQTSFDTGNTVTIARFDTTAEKITDSKSIAVKDYNFEGPEPEVKKTDFSQYMHFNFYQLSENEKYLPFTISDDAVFILPLDGSAARKIRLSKDAAIDDVSVGNDGKMVAVLSRDEEKYKYGIYAAGKIIVEQEVPINAVHGFSILGADPIWLEQHEPLLEHDYMARTSDDLLDKNIPPSFTKVHMAHLVNDDAKSDDVKKLLAKFFADSKPKDQVVVFLAGHGVLDQSKKYYYAPHDMDFSNVSDKGIAFDFIIDALKTAPAANKLLLMDSCHSGNTIDQIAVGDTAGHAGISGNRGSGAVSAAKAEFKVSDVVADLFENFLSTSGITVISAASGADVAYETKELGNGAFTSAYLTMLKEKLNRVGLLAQEELMRPVELNPDIITGLFKQVMLLTNNKQVPDLREVNENARLFMW